MKSLAIVLTATLATQYQLGQSAGGRNHPVGTTGSTSGSGDIRMPTGHVEPPASTYRTYDENGDLRVRVPANWREVQSASSVTFAPDGAYGARDDGRTIFTHGIEIGFVRNEAHDVRKATEELIDSLVQGNKRLSHQSRYDRAAIANRPGLRTTLSHVSEATGGRETMEVFTAQLENGTLLYAVGVAPSNAGPPYGRVFDHIVGSIEMRR